MRSCIYLLALAFVGVAWGAGSQIDQAEDGNSGTISFSTPDLSDDEAHSPWMPDMLKCDGCRGISHQLWFAFHKYNDKRKSLKYKIPESELLDLVEELCHDSKVWEQYGMKQVKKVNRLSGPGLETAEVPGVTAGGGKWPARLMDMCDQFMGELGELVIYDVYKKSPDNSKKLESYLCRGKGIRGQCNEKKPEKKNKKKEEL